MTHDTLLHKAFFKFCHFTLYGIQLIYITSFRKRKMKKILYSTRKEREGGMEGGWEGGKGRKSQKERDTHYLDDLIQVMDKIMF